VTQTTEPRPRAAGSGDAVCLSSSSAADAQSNSPPRPNPQIKFQTPAGIDYAEINRLAKERRKSVSDFVALAVCNDPFYADCAGRRASSEWFAEQYEREGFATGTHIRRIHYRLISRAAQTDWRGNPYQNTNTCWQALLQASRDARYLGTVPLDDFDDRRNPTAVAPGIDSSG
jgi:hypothetical protein